LEECGVAIHIDIRCEKMLSFLNRNSQLEERKALLEKYKGLWEEDDN